jgi:hypothetical protein
MPGLTNLVLPSGNGKWGIGMAWNSVEKPGVDEAVEELRTGRKRRARAMASREVIRKWAAGCSGWAGKEFKTV